MSPPAIGLLSGALLVGLSAPTLLLRQRGLLAAPRLGLAAWFGAAGAFLVMLVLAGPITLLDPRVEAAPLVASDVRSFVAGCVGLLHRPGVSSLITALMSTGATAYVAFVLTRHALRSRRDSKAHRADLRALGTPDPHTGVIVVEHARPLCYCLAGRPRHIVLSTAARDTLSDAQLDAVLAHERAHMTGHHHALQMLARGLATALPFLPLFRALPEQVELLIERLADERAGTSCGRSTVARALVRMATHTLPGPALGATGGNLATRMTYLLHPATAAHIGPSAIVLSPAVALAIALGPTALLTLACQLSWAP